MGQTKSKPFVESARNVIARRNNEKLTEKLGNKIGLSKPADIILNQTTPGELAIPKAADENVNTIKNDNQSIEINPEILEKISKWSVVKTSTKKETNINLGNMSQMASIIRLKEQAAYSLVKEISPGRLSPENLTKLLRELRISHDAGIIDSLAKEYNLSSDIIGQLSLSVKYPIIVTEKGGNRTQKVAE